MNTREQILKTALDLFAEKGFENVSVRDVTKAADVNLASVSYHFGGKAGLIQETVKLCMNPINEYRIKLLNEERYKREDDEKIPLERIMNALIRPAVMSEECGVNSDLLLRLAARYLIEAEYNVPTVSKNIYMDAFHLFAKELLRHFPHLDVEQIVKHITFVSGAVIYHQGLGAKAMQISAGGTGEVKAVDREVLLKDSIDFAINGFGGKAK